MRIPGARFGWELLALLVFTLLAAAWSWPACDLSSPVLVARQFDAFPASWLVDAAPGLSPQLLSSGTAWPYGESLQRVDSFVLLGLGWLLHGLLPGRVVIQLLAWSGPAISATAAESCARRGFGVRAPWSYAAGLAYGFSGIAACAIAEGHVYDLLNPWFPLLILAVRTFDPARHRPLWRGLVVGALGVLAALTSGYFGVMTAVLVVAAMGASPRERLRLVPGIAAVALPVMAWYLWLYRLPQPWHDPLLEASPDLAVGSSSLLSLTTWTPGIDAVAHSVGAPLGFVLLGLVLLAPALRPHPRGWRWVFVLALVSLLLSFGFTFRLGVTDPGIPGLLAPLRGLPVWSLFRFPVRLLWLWGLCGGLLAAMSLGALARRVSLRWVLPVLVAMGAEVFLTNGLPGRFGGPEAGVPSAYAAAPAELPVLDLWGPEAASWSSELKLWSRGLGCYYAGEHKRPILEVCLGTANRSPRATVERWLLRESDRMSAAPESSTDPTATLATLRALGIGAVALHADFFAPEDLASTRALLEATCGESVAVSDDGGEELLLYAVPGAGPVDRGAARATWIEMDTEDQRREMGEGV